MPCVLEQTTAGDIKKTKVTQNKSRFFGVFMALVWEQYQILRSNAILQVILYNTFTNAFGLLRRGQ
jgi:hypothetical protein